MQQVRGEDDVKGGRAWKRAGQTGVTGGLCLLPNGGPNLGQHGARVTATIVPPVPFSILCRISNALPLLDSYSPSKSERKVDESESGRNRRESVVELPTGNMRWRQRKMDWNRAGEILLQ